MRDLISNSTVLLETNLYSMPFYLEKKKRKQNIIYLLATKFLFEKLKKRTKGL